MLTPKEFAARLFSLIHELEGRERHRISQGAFGEMVGVHQGTVSAWLRGAYLPDMPAMLAILDKTGARAGWMFEGEGPMFRPGGVPETTKPQREAGAKKKSGRGVVVMRPSEDRRRKAR